MLRALMTDLTEDLARLFEALPKDFVETRNGVSRSLRLAGQKDEAKRIAALPRPTPPSWALNQIARRQPHLLSAYLERADEVARAQLEGRVRGDLLGTKEALRAAERAVTDALGPHLVRAEITVSRPLIDRALRTLEASAMEPAARATLRAGTLTVDLAPADFSAFARLAESQGFLGVAASVSNDAPTPTPANSSEDADGAEDAEEGHAPPLADRPGKADERAAPSEEERAAALRAEEDRILEQARQIQESRAARLREELMGARDQAHEALSVALGQEAALIAAEVEMQARVEALSEELRALTSQIEAGRAAILEATQNVGEARERWSALDQKLEAL